jgi:hypothetical protein
LNTDDTTFDTRNGVIAIENISTFVAGLGVLCIASLCFNMYLGGQLRTLTAATAALQVFEVQQGGEQTDLKQHVRELQAKHGLAALN